MLFGLIYNANLSQPPPSANSSSATLMLCRFDNFEESPRVSCTQACGARTHTRYTDECRDRSSVL